MNMKSTGKSAPLCQNFFTRLSGHSEENVLTSHKSIHDQEEQLETAKQKERKAIWKRKRQHHLMTRSMSKCNKLCSLIINTIAKEFFAH